MTISLGMVIYASVKPIFKIYFIIGMGFYLAKRNILTVTTCRDISDLVVSAIMPCLIFNNVVTYLKSSDIKNIGIIFFEGTLLYIVGVSLAYVTSIISKSPKRWMGGLLSVGLFPNISDLPIAYLQTLSKGDVVFSASDGDKGVAYVCIFLASQVFYQFSLGLYRLVEWDFRDELKTVSDDDQEKYLPDTSSLDHSHGHITQKSTPVEPESEREPVADVSLTNTRNDYSSINSDDDLPDEPTTSSNRNPPSPNETAQHDEFLRQREMEMSRITSNPRSSISTGYSEDQSASLSQTRSRSRRRSNSLSTNSNYYSLNPITSRTVDLRQQKSQDISDVINEYSEFDRLRRNEVRRVLSTTTEIGIESIKSNDLTAPSPGPEKETKLLGRRIFTNLLQTLKNFAAPNSVALIVSIAIAMAPPLKALFVASTHVHIHPAPDGLPPLSFIIDITSYVGNASVPLGLLLLGATISRLKINAMPDGFWKTAVALTAVRLIILPIFGVGLTTGIHKAGWFGSDKLVRFVSVLEFGLPSATSLVYFTAFYTDPQSDDHLQMDCLAVVCIAQYLILWFTLPFLVTFTLKVSLGY